MGQIPFACDMYALDPEERSEHAAVLKYLFGSVERIDELSQGYAFLIPASASSITAAAEFISLERLCCPFFSFALEFPAAMPSLRLSITGPAGIKPFIQEEFRAVLAPTHVFMTGADDPR